MKGKLVICDVCDAQSAHLQKDTDRIENVQSTENSSEVDSRTIISEPCDSIVPLSCSESSLSASEIPGIPCHVGNYSTVIEVSCQDTTAPAANDSVIDHAISVPPTENGPQSLSQTESNSVSTCSIDWYEKQNMLNHFIYSKDLDESPKKQSNSNVWYDFLLKKRSSLMNGDCSEMDESDSTDFEKIQKFMPAQHSVTVNGMCISSAEMLSDSLNCEAVPVVNFVSRKNKQYNHENEDQEMDEAYSSSEVNISENIESIQVSVQSPGAVLDSETESPVVTDQDCGSIVSVDNDDESAFNHFQYWRTPLPDVDVDCLCNDLYNSEEKFNKSRTSSYDQNPYIVNCTSLESSYLER